MNTSQRAIRRRDATANAAPTDPRAELATLYGFLADWSGSLGMTHFLFRLSVNHPGSRPNVILIYNYPDIWTDYYRANLQYDIDPIFRHCRKSSSPIFWNEAKRPSDVKPGDYERFSQKIRAAGLHSGISFPLHGPFGEWGMLNLNGPTPLYRSEARATEIIQSGYLACCHLQDAARRIVGARVGKAGYENLTRRQKECLRWIIEGKTTWEISRILDISERTVVFHIQNSFEILNVKNRTQAAAKAYSYLHAEFGLLNEVESASGGTLEYRGHYCPPAQS